jgi:O-antigen/teichoic acid export membrane protein
MFARSLTLNMIGYGSSLVIGFVSSVVLARMLGPSDRGLLGLQLTVASIAYALVGFGLASSAEYHAGRREPPGSIFGTTAAYALVLALVFVPLSWVLRQPIADLFSRGEGGTTWILAGALIPLFFLQYTSNNEISGLLQFGRFNGLMILTKLLYTVGVVALLLAGLGVSAGLIATGAAAVVGIAGAAQSILRLDRIRVDLGLFRRMVSYGSRLQLSTLFQIANVRLDVLILQFFAPLADVGYYIVAQVVAELVTILANGFQSSVMPLVANADDEEGRDRTTILALRHQALLTAVAIAMIAVLGPVLLLAGYGPRFHASLLPMFILLPGMWFLNAGSVINAGLGGRGRAGLASRLSAVALVVTVVLDLALIPPFGVIGAAIASLCSYTAFGVVALVVTARMFGIGTVALVRPTRADLSVYSRGAAALVERARRIRSPS